MPNQGRGKVGKTRSPKGPAKRLPVVLLVAVVCLSGCQCGPLYEGYAGFVDSVSDQLPLLERFYVPQLDISRIGQPNWCQSPINRLLAPCECRHVVQQAAVVPVAAELAERDDAETGRKDALKAGAGGAVEPFAERVDVRRAAFEQGEAIPDTMPAETE